MLVLDLKKLEEWQTILSDDITKQDWFGSDSESSNEENSNSEDEESDEEESSMEID